MIELARSHPDYIDASFQKTPLQDWTQYKAWFALDGNSFASNTLEALLSGSVMLRHEAVASYEWFEPWLQPYKHYVPIAYNLSDVISKLDWVRSHDTEAAEIAAKAMSFAEQISTAGAKRTYYKRALME